MLLVNTSYAGAAAAPVPNTPSLSYVELEALGPRTGSKKSSSNTGLVPAAAADDEEGPLNESKIESRGGPEAEAAWTGAPKRPS